MNILAKVVKYFPKCARFAFVSGFSISGFSTAQPDKCSVLGVRCMITSEKDDQCEYIIEALFESSTISANACNTHCLSRALRAQRMDCVAFKERILAPNFCFSCTRISYLSAATRNTALGCTDI